MDNNNTFILGLELILDKLIKLSRHIDTNPFNRRTPLHLAIENALEKVTIVLLQNGADANVTDHSGRTPLHTAATSGNLQKSVQKPNIIH